MATAYSGVFRAGSGGHALWVAQWPSFEAKWKELSGQGLRLTSISAQELSGGTSYAGSYRAGTDAHALWVAQWPSFEAKWKELSGQGLRLTSLAAFEHGGVTSYAGAYRAGTDAHALWVAQWPSFEAKWKELSGQGLRLTSLAAFEHGGVTSYAGAYRAGTDAHALWVSQWPSFEAKWKELSDRGLRLTSIAATVHGGVTYYGGVFRAGSGGHALWVSQGPSFVAKWKELSDQGLRLVSLDSYIHGGNRYYAGVYRPGTDGHVLWVGVDWENFVAKWRQLSQQGQRLIDMTLYPHPCAADCLNHVVMPTDSYNYGITRTQTHCPGLPGTCGSPGPGDRVFYRWPVDVEGGSRFVRLTAIEHDDQFLTLPFSDSKVERRGVWRYSNGGWHHAGDYSRDDSATFQIRACAPGRVIHMGWDNWSGNTVIVSHDVGGKQDAYRTIYMHMRNGASNDCEAAWSQTVPTLSEPERSEYIQHLNDTGCPQNPPRNPDPAHWGTNQQTLPAILNQQVARGAFLGWCGNTGPGGKKGLGGPNTHLHIFFCRRDPTNDEWYFFDPYGVYSLPGCYAANVTDATTGPCVRYPIAWKFGKPQYP
jgi:Polyglycine hydrolase-like, structural repeat